LKKILEPDAVPYYMPAVHRSYYSPFTYLAFWKTCIYYPEWIYYYYVKELLMNIVKMINSKLPSIFLTYWDN